MTGRFPRGSLSPKCRLSISQLTRSEWAVIVHFFFYQFQFTRRRDWFLKIKLTPIDSPSSALQFWFWLRGHQTEGSATKWRKLRVVSAIYRHLNALRQCAIQQLSSEWMKCWIKSSYSQFSRKVYDGSFEYSNESSGCQTSVFSKLSIQWNYIIVGLS